MNIYFKSIFSILIFSILNSCAGGSSSNSDKEDTQDEFQVNDIEYRILLSDKTTISSSISPLGKSIEIIVSSEDLLQLLPEEQELINSIDFDAERLVLIKSDQRSASNDLSIDLNSIKAYDNGSYQNHTKVDINYIQFSGNDCELDVNETVHYLLFAVDKEYSEMFFIESLDYQTCVP